MVCHRVRISPAPFLFMLLLILTSCRGGLIPNGDTEIFPEAFDSTVTYDTEIYVSPSGDDDTGDGSESLPYESLTFAASVADPGTRINLQEGSYPFSNIIELRGTSESPIAIRGIGSVSIGGSNGASFVKPAWLVIENVSISDSEAFGISVEDDSDYDNPSAAHHVILRDITVSNPVSHGIFLRGVSDFLVESCTVDCAGAGNDGMAFQGCHDGIVTDNVVRNVNPSNSGSQGFGISAGCTDILLHGNEVTNVGGAAFYIGDPVDYTYYRPSLEIGSTGNYASEDIVVESNIITGSGMGVCVFDSSTGGIFVNNTVVDPLMFLFRTVQSTTSNSDFGFTACNSGQIRNNIVVYETTEITMESRVFNIGSDTDPSTFTVSNNLWWAEDQDASYETTYPSGIPEETDAIYQADPQFTNRAEGDYTIPSGSPAAGSGIDVPAASGFDADYEYFGDPPPIGAYRP